MSLQDYYDVSASKTSDATDHELLIIYYLKYAAGAQTQAVNLLQQNPAGGGSSNFGLALSTSGLFTVNSQGTYAAANPTANTGAGAPLQLAMHLKPNLVELYLNTALAKSITTGPAAYTSPGTFAGVTYWGAFIGTFYGLEIHDVKTSGLTMTSLLNSSYAYQTGVGAGSASTANPRGLAARYNPLT